MPATQTASAERRGDAARAMVAEDSRWAMDIALSSLARRNIQGIVPLVLGHHLVRIAYEGSVTLKAVDPAVGIPALAALIEDKFETITARTRHTSKVLDNTSTNYGKLVAELELLQDEHHREFTGKALRWLRWLETDLGLYQLRAGVVGATVPAAYRLGFRFDRNGLSADDIREVSVEWGGTLAVLGAAAGDTSKPESTMSFRTTPIRSVDKMAASYFDRRFDRAFPLGLKELLLMIEGDLNTARAVLPGTATGHELPVFRAQVVTAYHSLSSLSMIASMNTASSTPGSAGLRLLLNDPPTKRLLSREGKNVRNRCVHYEIKDPRIEPNPSLPMFGLVESVYPGNTWESYYEDVKSVTNRLADHMASWIC
jgi:hypothetical protein